MILLTRRRTAFAIFIHQKPVKMSAGSAGYQQFAPGTKIGDIVRELKAQGLYNAASTIKEPAKNQFTPPLPAQDGPVDSTTYPPQIQQPKSIFERQLPAINVAGVSTVPAGPQTQASASPTSPVAPAPPATAVMMAQPQPMMMEDAGALHRQITALEQQVRELGARDAQMRADIARLNVANAELATFNSQLENVIKDVYTQNATHSARVNSTTLAHHNEMMRMKEQMRSMINAEMQIMQQAMRNLDLMFPARLPPQP